MHTINQIGKRFWYITPVSSTDRPILGMVVGNNKTLMIDAGNSEDHANYFIKALADQEVPNPDMVALTHWHWDHIFGLSALRHITSIASKATKKEMEKLLPFSWSDEAIDARVQEGIEIEFCARAIKEEFKDHRNIEITLPDITFEKRLEIDLGGVTCIIQYVGGDHAQDSAIIYIPEEKILFLGDCIYPNLYAKKENYTVKETLRLLDVLEEFEADTYIPSHQKPISKAAFDEETAKLRTIAQLTERYAGNHENIVKEYENHVKRELTEDEKEAIINFVNGF